MKQYFSLLCLLFVSGWTLAQTQIPAQFNHVDRLVRGTLSMPTGTGPFPAVVIVPGSGANDRDGTALLAGGYAPCLYPQLVGQTLRPYRDLGNALVDAGFAVLRYDKLEFSYPTNLGVITFDKLWLPANSALNWLKTRAEIDTNRLVLIGHSEGSSLIPWLALQRTDVSALISLAGARTPFDSVLARQLVDFAQQCNGNLTQAQTEATQILTYFNLVRQGPPPPTTPPLFGVPAAVWRTYTQVTDSVAHRYNVAAKPSLFVGLGADVNVPPSELSRFQSEVNITNQFWLLPGINHFLSTNSQAAFASVVADTIVHWLRQQGLASVSTLQSVDGWRMYPNPAVEAVTLQAPTALTQGMWWKLLDMQGRMVMQGKWEAGETQFKIALNDLQPGLYHLHREGGNWKALRLLKISR